MSRSFADMKEAISQYNNGLLHLPELLLALQMSEAQVEACVQFNALPEPVKQNTCLSQWDSFIKAVELKREQEQEQGLYFPKGDFEGVSP